MQAPRTPSRHTAHYAAFALVALAACASSCYVPPREDELRLSFRQHREEFQQLMALYEGDAQVRRLSADDPPPDGMSKERFARYAGHLSRLQLSGPLVRYRWGPNAVFLYARTWVGAREQPMAVGYVYAPQIELPVVQALPVASNLSRNAQTCISYVQIEPHWYLFHEANEFAASGPPAPCAGSSTTAAARN